MLLQIADEDRKDLIRWRDTIAWLENSDNQARLNETVDRINDLIGETTGLTTGLLDQWLSNTGFRDLPRDEADRQTQLLSLRSLRWDLLHFESMADTSWQGQGARARVRTTANRVRNVLGILERSIGKSQYTLGELREYVEEKRVGRVAQAVQMMRDGRENE